MKTTRLFMLMVLWVAVLFFAACGGEGRQSGTPSEGDAPGGEDFSVKTIEGERFDLSGGRSEVVALYIMAGW